jgi:hypothetical protein
MVSAFQQRLDTDVAIATSAALDDEQHDRVRMTVLLAMTAPIPLEARPKLDSLPTQPAPRVLGDTVSLAAIAAKKKSAGAKIADAETKPAPKPAKARPAALPAEPEPVFIPPIAVVEETIVETPSALDSLTDRETEDSRSLRYVEAKQEEMQFEATRGRFEKTAETIYRGENLDLPTFRRRRLAIRL